jgi:hypothetical protein
VPEYEFDIQLNATVRLDADYEPEARRHLNALQRVFQIDHSIRTTDAEIRIAQAHMAHDADESDLENTRPVPRPAQPLYQAGFGSYSPVLDLTQALGWTRYNDASGDNHTDVSPDKELSVQFGPEADTPHIAPLWRVVHRGPDPYRREKFFAAYFDGNVPAEAIAAFLTALTGPSPRPTDTDS